MVATTTIEFDTVLLTRLKQRYPDKKPRALPEDLARIDLGCRTLEDLQRRNALSEEEAGRLADEALREVRATSR